MDDLFDEDANITFDRSTTTVNLWDVVDEILLSSACVIVDTAQAKKLALEARVPNTVTICFDSPCQLKSGRGYDIEHNLLPTDVTNHFSGAPFTHFGADLWTCWGVQKQAKSPNGRFFRASSCKEIRRGRCSLEEGQLPYICFWPLL